MEPLKLSRGHYFKSGFDAGYNSVDTTVEIKLEMAINMLEFITKQNDLKAARLAQKALDEIKGSECDPNNDPNRVKESK
jgi:hypothetical protein